MKSDVRLLFHYAAVESLRSLLAFFAIGLICASATSLKAQVQSQGAVQSQSESQQSKAAMIAYRVIVDTLVAKDVKFQIEFHHESPPTVKVDPRQMRDRDMVDLERLMGQIWRENGDAFPDRLGLKISWPIADTRPDSTLDGRGGAGLLRALKAHLDVNTNAQHRRDGILVFARVVARKN